MKVLKTKQQICEALNFNKYPILHLDLAKDKIKDMEGCYCGQVIKAEFPYKNEVLYYSGKLCYYGDTNTLLLSSGGTFLKATFDYNDIIEMIEKNQAPTVKADQEVVVVITNSDKKKSAFPVLTKVSKLAPTMQTLAVIEGDFKEIIETII